MRVINLCSATRSFLSNDFVCDSLQNLLSAPYRPRVLLAPSGFVINRDDHDGLTTAQLPVKRDATRAFIVGDRPATSVGYDLNTPLIRSVIPHDSVVRPNYELIRTKICSASCL